MGWTSGTVASSLFTGQKDVLNFLWTVDGNAGHVHYRGASVRVKHPIMSSSTCIGVSGYRHFDLKQVQLLYIYITMDALALAVQNQHTESN